MATRRARSDEDKLARRAEILDAARQVFDGGEIDAFTMDDVAAALELAKGTLYRYFPTRESLLLALADDEYQQWFARVDEALIASDLNASHVGAFAQLLLERAWLLVVRGVDVRGFGVRRRRRCGRLSRIQSLTTIPRVEARESNGCGSSRSGAGSR